MISVRTMSILSTFNMIVESIGRIVFGLLQSTVSDWLKINFL